MSRKITEADLKADFELFVIYVWKLLMLPPPTKVQLLICRFLADERFERKIIEAFRGVGKSYITYAFVVWKLWSNPSLIFLVVSASSSRANDFSATCQRLIDLVPCLRHLKPTDSKTKWTKIQWTVAGSKVSGSESVTSKGVTSQITGGRADYIIADDVEVPANAYTQEQRDKLRNTVREFEAIKKGNEGDGLKSQIIYLGTPQCEESLYNELAKGLYKVRIWPARYPRMDKLPDYEGKLCPTLENELYELPELSEEPTDPKRFTDEELAKSEIEYGKAGFALQFMMDTSLSDALRFPLKTNDILVFNPADSKAPPSLSWSGDKSLIINDLPRLGFSADYWRKPMWVEPGYLPYEQVVLAVDPSGRGRDETGYAVIKSLMGYLFVTRAGGLKGGFDEKSCLRPLAAIAKEEGATMVVIESNFGDGMFSELFKPILNAIHPCDIDEVRHNTQKERRIIDTLEPVMARHRLVVSSEVVLSDYETSHNQVDPDTGQTKTHCSLFHQMTHITADKGSLTHDDRLDALAIGVAYFKDSMARTEATEIARRRSNDLEKLIREKSKNVHGSYRIRSSFSSAYGHTDPGNMLTHF